MQIKVVRAPETLTSNPGLAMAINTLGKQSAIVCLSHDDTVYEVNYCYNATYFPMRQAQSLSREITSAELLAMPRATDQRQLLCLAIEDGKVLGFLKSGVKHLFYVDRNGIYSEFNPICVLDFYVDETWQRRGVGLQLFQHFLQEECVTPAQLAYDRPSPKLFAFLKKHTGLTQYFPQPNRFVIFDAFF